MRTQHILSFVIVLLFCGGAIAAEPAPYPHEPAKKVTQYTAQVTCDADGKIANINLRGPGLPEKGIDYKADVKAFRDKLKELTAKHNKDNPAALTIEIADKLIQQYVVELIDAAVRAGFTDISPVPIDKSKR